MELDLPSGYTSWPYHGPSDHPAMASVLGAVRRATIDNELPTAAQFDLTYAGFDDDECVPARDVALILADAVGDARRHTGVDETSRVVGYVRAAREAYASGVVYGTCFPVIHPDHLTAKLYTATMRALEHHIVGVDWPTSRPSTYLAFAPHPGPGLPADGQASWLEALGYEAFRFGATLVRPHLDDIPDLPLPPGVEMRPVEPEHLRRIWEVHQEAFRGQWDFAEPDEADFRACVDDPMQDTSLWKIAWAGDDVIGQVKSFVNVEENAAEGRRRGYTENISTRADWRGRGVAAALLCASLRELRDRGLSEAALGADVDNPSAFGLYQRLGFVVTTYEAVYRKAIG